MVSSKVAVALGLCQWFALGLSYDVGFTAQVRR